MVNRGKRYRGNLEKIDRERTCSTEEALTILRSLSSARFDETVELAVELGVDPKQSDQQVRGTVSLPNGIGKTLRVAVFAEGEKAEEARQAGADVVGGDDLISRVQEGWTEFDVAIAVPGMMGKVGKLGRFLGPRGLMPSPKGGTVRDDMTDAVAEFKAGKIEVRSDSGGNVHAPVGKLSFSDEALVANIEYLLDHLLRIKPSGAKGRYMKKIVLSSTMSPGISIQVTR